MIFLMTLPTIKFLNKKPMYKHFDGYESKLAMCVLAIIQGNQTTSTFSYFVTYSVHDLT